MNMMTGLSVIGQRCLPIRLLLFMRSFMPLYLQVMTLRSWRLFRRSGEGVVKVDEKNRLKNLVLDHPFAHSWDKPEGAPLDSC